MAPSMSPQWGCGSGGATWALSVSPPWSCSGGGTWQPGCPQASHQSPCPPVPADAAGQRLGEAEPGQPGRGGRQRPRHPHQAGQRWWRWWWWWWDTTRSSAIPKLVPPLTVPLSPPSPSLCPQSFLLKRSGNSLNKEWKKKYVTLSSNGLLFYHPTINVSVPVPRPHGALGGWGGTSGSPRSQPPRPSPPQDYIHSTHGKEMDLLRTTVKVPGKRPPRAISACGPSASINGLVKDVAPEGGGEYRPGDDGCPRRTPGVTAPSPPHSRRLPRGAEPPPGAGDEGSRQRREVPAALRLRLQRQALRLR